MTTRRPTARERIADWTLAYHVMLEEMTASLPDGTEIVGVPGIVPLSGTRWAETVIEGTLVQDRRTAALAAAILVANAGASTSAVAGSFEDSLDG